MADVFEENERRRPVTAEVNLIDSPGTAEDAWQHWIGLACLPIAQLAGIGSAVVIAAHPDDEVLGVGGTMAQLVAAGVRLRIIAATDGEGSHPEADPRLIAAQRAAESAAALRALQIGSAEVIRLRLPDTSLGRCEGELASRFAGTLRRFRRLFRPVGIRRPCRPRGSLAAPPARRALWCCIIRSGCGTGRLRLIRACPGAGPGRFR